MHMCTACNAFLVFRPTTRKSDQLMNEIISSMQEGLQNSNREFLKRTRTHADLEMSGGKKRMLDVPQAASLDLKVESPQRGSDKPSVNDVIAENCSRAYASLAKDRTVRADVFKTQFLRTVTFTNWQEDDSGDVSVKQIADRLGVHRSRLSTVLRDAKAAQETGAAWLDVGGRATRIDKVDLSWVTDWWHRHCRVNPDARAARSKKNDLGGRDVHSNHIQMNTLQELYDDFLKSSEYAEWCEANPTKTIGAPRVSAAVCGEV